MDRDSVERLRHDRRLVRRREWVSVEDRASFFESLPDVSDKMTRGFDEPDEEAAAKPAETAAPSQSFSSPSAAPSFGTSETAAASTPEPAFRSGPFGGGGSDSSGGGSSS